MQAASDTTHRKTLLKALGLTALAAFVGPRLFARGRTGGKPAWERKGLVAQADPRAVARGHERI